MKTMKPVPTPIAHKWLWSIALLTVMGATIVAILFWTESPRPDAGPETVVVYKRATCNCCAKWVTHLERAGFEVQVHNESDLTGRQNELGTPQDLRTCHTAVVGGYVIEGHVSAQDIRRLLIDQPKARGLAVPGMPIGSPGMEMGERRDPYATLLIQADGQSTMFAQHGDQP